MDPARWSDRVVAVTGGASGIGAAVARAFVTRGAPVAVMDRDAEALGKLRIPGADGTWSVQVDVSVPAQVEAAFEALDSALGPLAVLISNAGISRRADFVEIPFADWRDVLAVNLDGVFLAGQAAARRMLVSGGGVILNMGSTNGLVGYRRHAAYSASKAAVVELTRCMALDLAPSIRVNVVCPGFVQTPLLTYGSEAADRVPLGRFATPEEIAALFVYLASDDAAFITGQSFSIDGGELAGGLASSM